MRATARTARPHVLPTTLGLLALVAGVLGPVGPATAEGAVPADQGSDQGTVGSLVVGYEDDAAPLDASALPDGAAVEPGRLSPELQTVTLAAPVDVAEAEQIAARLEALPEVRWAEPDRAVGLPDAWEPEPAQVTVASTPAEGAVSTTATQASPPWGLDRIDQRSPARDSTYTWVGGGAGITAYVVDTGVSPTHAELAGRVAPGFTSIADGRGTVDCHGHGTHVAGTVGGTTFGVAKNVTIVPVRVLDCAGNGTTQTAIEGLTWIRSQHPDGVPAVANLSLSGPPSDALDDAVRALVAEGVTVVVAAGNEGAPACDVSPARVAQAVTVGASTREDTAADFSNFGPCVDLYAPGVDIVSAGLASDTSAVTASGTSMAAPHVTGVVALRMDRSAQNLRGDVDGATAPTALLDGATPVDLYPPDPTDAKRLLYSRLGGRPLGSLDAADAASGSIRVRGWALDPDSDAPVDVAVTVDGAARTVRADRPRTDIARLFPALGGDHGFDTTVAATPGPHRVCVTGRNVGAGADALLTCTSATVPVTSPVGSFERLVPTAGGVRVTGWALDGDTTDPIYLLVTVDGRPSYVRASGARPDVARVFPGYGENHGFDAVVPASPGAHTVCLTASNVGSGSHTSLGCRSTTVLSGAPLGNFERLTGEPGALTLSGWALDPDTTSPVYLLVTVNGRAQYVRASTGRPDIARYFPGYGTAHGFAARIVVPAAATYRVCVTASNVGAGAHTGLGCRVVSGG